MLTRIVCVAMTICLCYNVHMYFMGEIGRIFTIIISLIAVIFWIIVDKDTFNF